MSMPKLKLPECLAGVVPPDLADQLLAALATEVERYVRDMVGRAVLRTLQANFGSALGAAVYANITDTASLPNSRLVGGSVSRSAVSKASVRIRRGLGLPAQCPQKARRKRKAVPAHQGHSIQSK